MSDLADKLPQTISERGFRTMHLILISVLLAGVGQLVFKAALNQIGELAISFQTLIDLATTPLMLLGLVIYGASALLWLLALMTVDLSFAYPFLSLTYVIVLGGGVLFFDEQLTVLRIVGASLVVAGLIIIARGSQPGE